MADVTETKEDRFVRLAGQRVPAAIKRISLIAKLSNRSSYAYSDEQIQKILSALREEVNRVEAAFTRKREATGTSFQL